MTSDRARSEVFGQRFLAARQAAGLSQDQVGKIIGARENDVRRWERGINFPQSYRLPAIASCLNVSIDWLFAVGEPESGDGDGSTPRRRRRGDRRGSARVA